MDSRLNFSKHIKEKVLKATKGITLLKFLSKYVDRGVLNSCFKLYVRPHLDYGDVIYHNQRGDLMDLIERVQYKAALIVSGCWQGTSREKLYDELGWEYLSDRRWCRRLTMFYKICNGYAPSYLQEHIPARVEIPHALRERKEIPPFARTERFENSFFPYTIKMWKELDAVAKSKTSVDSFKKYLNSFIRPPGHSLFGVRDKFGVKLLTQIRVDFSDLRSHRFNHSFNCPSPICSCETGEETSVHFFLHCPRYTRQRSILLSKISDIIHSNVSVLPDEHLYHILVYGSNVYNSVSNGLILTETISYIRLTGRFAKLEAFN